MIRRKLGMSGIDVSAVGLGTWSLGGWAWPGTDETKAIDGIHAALDHGVNLIDTAPSYGSGRSEEIVGRAIRGRREKVVLATKCGLIYEPREGSTLFCEYKADGATSRPSETLYLCLRPESIRKELEGSLRRLGTTYIDLLQTHWQTPATPIVDTMGMLMKLQDEGKIRAIGVSNVTLDQLKSYGPIDADQEKFSMIDREVERNGLLPHCHRTCVSMLAYSPLAYGLLGGKILPSQRFPAGDVRKDNPVFAPANVERINAMLDQIRPIAERRRATLAQVVIAWTVAQPGVSSVLCGARDPEHAIENAGAGEISLFSEELETINALLRDYDNCRDSQAA
jgi:methylglyoxal reductase